MAKQHYNIDNGYDILESIIDVYSQDESDAYIQNGYIEKYEDLYLVDRIIID